MGLPLIPRNDLMGEIARLNTPITDENTADHPLTQLVSTMRSEHPTIHAWGTFVGNHLNHGLGGSDEQPLPEKSAFDNAYLAAYGLARTCYAISERPLPDDERFRPSYRFVHGGNHHEYPDTIGTLFKELNRRQHLVADGRAYPAFLEATQAYAYNRMPGHGQGYRVGSVAVAAAEMFFVFDALETKYPSADYIAAHRIE